MRRVLTLALIGAATLLFPSVAVAEDPPSVRDRVEELQQELDSLTEEVEDLQEPVGEFDLFDECMYTIGVTEYGRADGAFGFLFGRGGAARRPGLALDIRGFGTPRYQLLAFPAEEPPSIECNEDAGQELIDN
jgi:hypothetical protein